MSLVLMYGSFPLELLVKFSGGFLLFYFLSNGNRMNQKQVVYLLCLHKETPPHLDLITNHHSWNNGRTNGDIQVQSGDSRDATKTFLCCKTLDEYGLCL